jgi:RHS repeat-associated protein
MSKLIHSRKGRIALLTLLLGFGLVAYLYSRPASAQEPQTEEQPDEGGPLPPEEEEGEDPNVDDCEKDQKGKKRRSRGDCIKELLAEAAGLAGGGNAGDGPSPVPEPGDPGWGPQEPAGESGTGDTGDKEQPGGNGTGESEPDPQGGGDDVGGDSGAPDQSGSEPEPAPSEGGEGETGGPDEGDGDADNKGGESEGEGNENCQSGGAHAQTPPPTDQDPVGGSTGANPGFLNPPVVLKYRSNDPTDGLVGVGWDANVFERVIANPTLNPAAALAWYPGDGSCHYFYGPAGGPYAPEAAIRDTHSIAYNPGSQPQRYVLTDKYGNSTYFNLGGRITLKQDRLGNQNVYGRNAADQLVSMSSSYGHANMWSFDYFPTGRLKSATDFSGRKTTFGYDATKHLKAVIFPATTLHPNGKKFQYAYLSGTGNPAVEGKMQQIIDPTGVTRVGFEYDTGGLLTKVTRGNAMHQLTITRTGPTTRDVIDFNGNHRRYTFQAGLHYPTKVELFGRGLRPDDPPSYVWEYEYSPERQVKKGTLPSGKVYEYTYDAGFNLTRRRVKSADPSTVIADWTWTYGAYNLAQTVTNPAGQTWTYNRDTRGLVTSLVTPDTGDGGSTFSYEYDSAGRLTKSTNARGRSITYLRFTSGPQAGFLQSATLSANGGGEVGTCSSSNVYGFTHNRRGWPLTVTDPTGATTTLTRDGADRVTGAITSGTVPAERQVTYNQLGLPHLVRRANRGTDGQVDPTKPWIDTHLVRDFRRRITTASGDFDATGTRTWTFQRDGLGNVTGVTTPAGRAQGFAYDERGLPLSRSVGTATVSTWSHAFHRSGSPKWTKDPLGQTTTFAEDGFGRIKSVTTPTGEVLSRELDTTGRPFRYDVRDGAAVLQRRVDLQYDGRDRPTTATFERFGHGGPAEQAIYAFEYDKLSRVTKDTLPLGRTYSHTYTGCGQLKTTQDDQTSGKTAYTYDGRGDVAVSERTETEGGTTRIHKHEYDRDPEGRLTEMREFDAANPGTAYATKYRYDGLSRLRRLERPDGSEVNYKYNHAGLAVEMEEWERLPGGGTPNKHKTAYEWDKDGNLLKVTDATNAVTQYEYDDRGWPKKTIQPDATTTVLAYDLAGRVTTATGNNGTVVTQTYDAAGRLTGRTIQRATGVLGTTGETFEYDSVGRLIRATDNDSVVEFTHDSLGNVLTEKQGPTLQQLRTITRTYDKEGRLTSMNYPGGLLTGVTTDAAGRLHTIMDGSATLVERTYVRTDLPAVQATLSGVAKTNYAFDGFARLAALSFQQVPGGGGPVTHWNVEHGYDNRHRRLFERRLHAGNSGPLFSYDDLGRTTRVLRGVADPQAELQNPGSQTWTTKVSYSLDGVGARTQVATTQWGGSPANTAYTGNNLHQYTAVGGTTRTYDPNGNLTADGTYSYKYDYRNQLVEVRLVSGGSLVAMYEYDALGRRIAKAVGSATTRFYYSSYDLIEVRDGSDVVTHQFVHGSGVDDLAVAIVRDVNDYDEDGNVSEHVRFSYHGDAVGSVRLITDATGAVVESYDYDEYGLATIRDPSGATITSSRIGNFFMFTAREFDPETGLLYYRARHYDPATGVFVQRDPAGFAYGYNLYEYVGSSPFIFRDPLGWGEEGPWWGSGKLPGQTSSYSCMHCHALPPSTRAELGKFWEPALPSPSQVADRAQVALDAASLSEVPVASQAAGLVSGVIDLVRGNFFGAGSALLGIIPFAGTAADAARLANRVKKCMDAGSDAGRAADKAADAAKASKAGTRAGDLPGKGKPNSTDVVDKGGGNGTIRDYGPDGKAKTDYDFGHDHGSGDPHAHDWNWLKPGSERQLGRPLKPGE